MAWEKASPELSALLEEALAGMDCTKRVMFGGPAWFSGGTMFTAVHQHSIILRLSEDDRAAIAAALPGVTPFTPTGDRPMREYVVLPKALYDDPEEFRAWLARSLAYAASLPPKVKKPRKRG